MEKILGLLKKDYINLGLEKKEATALRDGFADYIKAVHYYHFALPTRTIPIQNKILNITRENVTKSDK